VPPGVISPSMVVSISARKVCGMPRGREAYPPGPRANSWVPQRTRMCPVMTQMPSSAVSPAEVPEGSGCHGDDGGTTDERH
jgi:hypothetical protein